MLVKKCGEFSSGSVMNCTSASGQLLCSFQSNRRHGNEIKKVWQQFLCD